MTRHGHTEDVTQTDTSYAWVVMTGGGAGGGRGDTETLVSLPQPLLSALVSPAQLEAT